MQGISLKESRPSYVNFERRPVEDRNASIAQGRYMTKDVDFVVITPIGSKDRIPRQIDEWFVQLDQQVREERIPAIWAQEYKKAYQAWKSGQEIPVNGTPIKGWGLLSPAQQANILGADIRTVEDLAQITDEAMKRIGMGALELREKAQAWLKSAGSQGKMAQEASGMQAKIRQLEKHVESLTAQNSDMKLELETLTTSLQGKGN